MTNQEIKDEIFERLETEWGEYEDQLLKLSPGQLIGRAEEIAAMSFCHNWLVANAFNGQNMDQLEYLLRFEKPLALVCEQWQDAQNVDYSADFSRILTDISEGDLEQDYPLMPDCPSPERGQTMC
ncbi:MAG: hypothetical protein QMB62_04680 [Oscillospiraceae bacterium]